MDTQLVRLYNDETMLKQYYLWQLNEENRDHFCYTPVGNGKMPYTEEGWERFHDAARERLLKKAYVEMLQNRETGDYLGWISLQSYNMRNQCAEISYYMPPEHRGKGLGSIMIDHFLRKVFSDDFFWSLHSIIAETGDFNTPSIRILEKAGFKLDGRVRDHYFLNDTFHDQLIFTLLKSEFNK